jgi:hypothetical protein
MKRSDAIKILSTVLVKYNTGAPWYNETQHAGEVLSLLEKVNLIKPTHKKIRILKDIENMPYEDEITVLGWEDE